MEAILQESTIYRRRERLSKITDGSGLEGAYGTTIERIRAQGGDKARLGIGALMWISYAEVPLGPDAPCHALAIELGSTDFNAGSIPSISTLVSCFQGLITVDKEESGVRLIHFTLKEYFSAHPDIFSRPHSAMAEVCLTYLNSQKVKGLSADSFANSATDSGDDSIDDSGDDSAADSDDDSLNDFGDDFSVYSSDIIYDTPFLEYCSLYWAVHAKRELSEHSRSLALQLLQEFDGHVSAELLLRAERSLLVGYSGTFSPLSGLHCASFFGIIEIVVALIDMGCCDANGVDFGGYTPLAWAASKGHEEVVKILLGSEEIDPDKPDKNCRTPLSYAAEEGHEEVVKILLGRKEVDPEKSDIHERTPLSHAAERGVEGVVNILLGRTRLVPIRQIIRAERRSHMRLDLIICRVGTTHCQLGKAPQA